MNVQINVGQETSAHEFRALATFFNQLASVGGDVSTGNVTPIVIPLASLREAISSQTVEPATVLDAQPGSQPPEAGSEKTKRARRTKAEIEAEAEAARIATAEAEARKNNEAELAKIEAGEKIDTATGEITTVEEFETVAGGKTYTEAEVQNLASSVARVKGPQIVKDKITELGATRIAALTADQLNSLGAYLETQK